MNLISDLLLLPITGPVRGIKSLLEAIRDEADATRFDLSRARAELSDLELRRDLGEISEEEYQEQEEILLNRLNASLAEEDRLLEQPPLLVDGEVVDYESEDGDNVDYGSEDGDYVDGEYTDEDDGAEPPEGRRR